MAEFPFVTSENNKFLEKTGEDGDHNQYWYSESTIKNMVEDIEKCEGRIAFLSTPSLYFSSSKEVQDRSYVFDFDKENATWKDDRGFVFFDFNIPTNADYEGEGTYIPEELVGTFDMVVIDPPFIVKEVWEKYAKTAKFLLKPDCTTNRVLGTTVFENASLMDELFGCKPQNYMPSIPHLVYQYNLYTNYQSDVFEKKNPEIPE